MTVQHGALLLVGDVPNSNCIVLLLKKLGRVRGREAPSILARYLFAQVLRQGRTHPRTAASRRQEKPVARKTDGIHRRVVTSQDAQGTHRHRLPQSQLIFQVCARLCTSRRLCVLVDGISCPRDPRSPPRPPPPHIYRRAHRAVTHTGVHDGTPICAVIRTGFETISTHRYRQRHARTRRTKMSTDRFVAAAGGNHRIICQARKWNVSVKNSTN